MENSFLEFEKWISELNPFDRIGFVTDHDTDGLTAGVIAVKSVEKLLGKKFPYVFMRDKRYPTKELFSFIEKNNITKLIVTDLNLGNDVELLSRLLEKVKVLIIDHHPLEKVEMEGLVHVSSHFFTDWKDPPVRYPASKICYDFFSKVVNILDLDWMACCGVIADMGTPSWKGFVKEMEKKYKISFKELQTASFAINAPRSMERESLEEFFWELYEMKKPQDVLNSKFNELNDILEHEMNVAKDKFIENHLIHEKLHVFEIKSKYKIFSSLCTMLSATEIIPFNHILIVIGDDGSDTLYIGARHQKGIIDTGKMLKKAVEGLEDSYAGGHAVASGGGIYKKDLEKFKEQLIKAYDELA